MNLTLDEIHPHLFINKQMCHKIINDLKTKKNGDEFIETTNEVTGSLFSITESISSRYRLNASQAMLDSTGKMDSFHTLSGIHNLDNQLGLEENFGISAVLDLTGYTDLIESLHEKVPGPILSRSLEGLVSKVC